MTDENAYPGQLLVDGEWPMIVVTHTRVQESREIGGYNDGGSWKYCCVDMPTRHEMRVSAGPSNLEQLIRPKDHPATLLLDGHPAMRGTVVLNNASTLRGLSSMDAVFTEGRGPDA